MELADAVQALGPARPSAVAGRVPLPAVPFAPRGEWHAALLAGRARRHESRNCSLVHEVESFDVEEASADAWRACESNELAVEAFCLDLAF